MTNVEVIIINYMPYSSSDKFFLNHFTKKILQEKQPKKQLHLIKSETS